MLKKRTRGDGFRGQHMLVLPEPLRIHFRKHPLLAGLLVTDAGYFPSAENHLVERPGGSPTTLLILCLRGQGWVRTAQAWHEISAGKCVWLPPNRAHAYGTTGTKQPWTIAWTHFSGTESEAWRALLGGSQSAELTLLDLPHDRMDEIGLERVYAALERGHALQHQIAAAAALRSSLSNMASLATTRGGLRSSVERVLASVETLRRDWSQSHRLEELATAAGVSVTHYSAIFRRHTGFAPIDFVIRERVQHACRLLDTTSLPIAEIAERCGYSDPYYFTRCFRRVMGRAPRDYRKIPKG